MSELSHVWIDSLVLGKALGCEAPKAKPKSDLDRNVPDWNFTRCFLLSGDLSAISTETPLHVKIDDLASEWNEKSATLTEATTAIYIDNAWETPPDDLITLTHLNEPSVVSALKKRYEEDLIYTSTGPILIALNPFKPLPGLYEDDQMSVYWAFGEGIDTNVLPPHVYGHADKAFRAMMQGIEAKMNTSDEESKIALTCDQSMLVSGESGAGKTVSTKHIMKYLASLSQRKAEHLKRRRAPSPGRGEDSAPRRNQSMRQMSRAQSWKAGAQIEEKSEYVYLFLGCCYCLVESAVSFLTILDSTLSLTHTFFKPCSCSLSFFFKFSNPTLSWKPLGMPGPFVTTIRLDSENSSSSNSSKVGLLLVLPLIPICWKKFALFIKRLANETFTSFMKCWPPLQMKNGKNFC